MKLKYAVFTVMILGLLFVAVAGPQILLRVQDNYRMEKLWQGTRNSLDVAWLDASYESMRIRMGKLAEGITEGRKFYVNGTDYPIEDDFYILLEQIFGQGTANCPEALEDCLCTADELYKNGFDVETFKKYVIYDEGFEETSAVVVMAWYVELGLTDSSSLKLLADTENHKIYYMQYVYNTEESKVNLMKWTKGYNESFNYDCLNYWMKYYEADEDKYERFRYDGINESVIGADKVVLSESDFFGIWKKTFSIQVPLKYGSYDCDWELGIVNAEKNNEEIFFLGLHELSQLIPEFIR